MKYTCMCRPSESLLHINITTTTITTTTIIIIILQSVLRQVHNPFQRNPPQVALQCFLVQFLVSSHFLKVIQQAQLLKSSSSSSRPFYHSFDNVFQKAVLTQDMTILVSVPSFYCIQATSVLLNSMLYFVSYTIRPPDLLHSSPAQHLKLPRYFRSTFRSVQFSTP